MYDIPEEIFNEIILIVPLIELFRVSKLSQLFHKLSYKKRQNISGSKEYEDAVVKGDILSLMNCSLTFFNNGLYAGYEGRNMDILHLMINKGESYSAENALCSLRPNDWNGGLCYACEGK